MTAGLLRLLLRTAEQQRAILRWQHPLKRETPNWHRAYRLNNECGWKGGDRSADGLRTMKKMQREVRPQRKSVYGFQKIKGSILAELVRLPLVGTEHPAQHEQRNTTGIIPLASPSSGDAINTVPRRHFFLAVFL